MDKRPHENSVRIFSRFAWAFRVDVDEQDKDRWSAALVMARALDILVDDDKIYDSGAYALRLIEGNPIPYLSEQEMTFIRSAYSTLSKESKERWQYSAQQLGAFALRRIEADTLATYVETVIDESTHMADVLLVENDGDRHDEPARDSFNSWLHTAAESVYLFDTFTDAMKDAREGNIGIDITPKVVTQLGILAAGSLVKLGQETLVHVYPACVSSVASKFIEKLRQPQSWISHFAFKEILR